MTDPSQYFKGRTVQEQMNEVIGYVDVRSAEVATDAIAADVAQVHQDMLDADADATAAAASAAAAAGTLANAVKKTGEASQSIAGDIAVAGDLSGGTVTVPTPVNNTDAASKKYVDDADALKINITDINTYAVGLTGNQNNIAGSKKFLAVPVMMGGYSDMYNYQDQTAVIKLSNTGSYSRTYIFEITESSGGGRAIVRFNITSSNIITETHNVLIGNMTTLPGIVITNDGVYLTISGYACFGNIYSRAGSGRRVSPTEVTPFDVSDQAAYPNQLVITW